MVCVSAISANQVYPSIKTKDLQEIVVAIEGIGTEDYDAVKRMDIEGQKVDGNAMQCKCSYR